MSKSVFLLPLVLLLPFLSPAQKGKAYKFEKVDASMLARKSYSIDSGAAAVVLADVGDTRIEGNSKGWFSFVFRRHRRVHILRQSAYDVATLEIPLYHNGYQSEERIESIKAVSYNLDGGTITESKLSKDAIFKEKQSKNVDLYKFTLPSVREGTIIDIEYRIQSDYLFTLQPWDFQEEYPVLWSEYNLSVPQFLDYLFIYKGYVSFAVADKVEHNEQFNMTEDASTANRTDHYSFSAGVTDYRWATTNVPAFISERYLSSRANYQAHMDLQLAGYRYPITPHNFVRSWPEVTGELLKDDRFGLAIDRENGWLRETVLPLTQNKNPRQQAETIYAWVRDHISCSGTRGIYMDNALKDVFRAGKGSVAEVNLLLVTMLRNAGLNANPVMLSTRDRGTVYTAFPMLTRFNYIIASVEVGGQTVLLDATKPRLGFGQLLPDCYNGIARTVSATADPLYLMSDSLKERELTMLFLPQKGANWDGSYSSIQGNYASYQKRNQLVEKGKESFFTSLRSGLGNGVQFSNGSLDSVDLVEQPLGIRGEIKMPIGDEDILYVNPMFGAGLDENPFHSDERLYPVEMPFTTDRTFLLTMHVPEGYEIEELPKQLRAALDDKGSGSFDYLISVSDGIISLRSQIRIRRANFEQEDYESLREFYNLIVAKHKEKIVFRKKKK